MSGFPDKRAARREMTEIVRMILTADLFERRGDHTTPRDAGQWVSPLGWRVVLGRRDTHPDLQDDPEVQSPPFTIYARIYKPDGELFAETDDATFAWVERELP